MRVLSLLLRPVDSRVGSGDQKFYGSPEVDETTPRVITAEPAADGRSVRLVVDGLVEGHVHEFDLGGIRSRDGADLLHTKAYYTLNRIPK